MTHLLQGKKHKTANLSAVAVVATSPSPAGSATILAQALRNPSLDFKAGRVRIATIPLSIPRAGRLIDGMLFGEGPWLLRVLRWLDLVNSCSVRIACRTVA